MTSPLPARRDPSTPNALRQGLDALAGIDPPYDVAAGAARLDARIAGAPAPVAATSTGSTKLLVVLAVVMLGAAIGWLLTDDGHEEQAFASPAARADAIPVQPTAPAATPPPPSPTQPDNADPPPAPERPAPRSESVDPPAVEVPKERTRRRRPRSEPESKPDEDPLMREMKLLNAARKHVAAGRYVAALSPISAANALESRRFGEEWRALEILALAGSGKLERARSLAEPYLRQHPSGRFNAKIERALESTG